MRLAILLFCGSFLFGQSASPTPDPKAQPPAGSSDPKRQNTDSGPVIDASGHPLWTVEILSDTQGVDFGPYLDLAMLRVRENWYRLIPQSAEKKKGKLAIEFAITKDGHVSGMKLAEPSGDTSLDRPAWASIMTSDPFPALPSQFGGQYLTLRFHFDYNPDKDNPAPDAGTVGIVGSNPKPEERSGTSGGIYHRGEGASDPRLISRVDPEFSEKARKAKYQGLCVLSLVVELDGTPSNIRVSQSLGMGLDEKAIEAVKQWRFQPAMKDGHPVRYGPVEIDVDFHLYNPPKSAGSTAQQSAPAAAASGAAGGGGSSQVSAADLELPRKLFTEATQAYGRHDYQTAVVLARQIMSMAPQVKGTRLVLGMSLLGLNQFDEAVAVLEDEIKIDPSSPYAYNDLARIYWRQHKYEDAIAQFQKQLTINPHDHTANQDVGLILRNQKRCREAMPYLETALAISAANFTTQLAHGECNLDLGNTAKGISEMEQATSAANPGIWNGAAYYLADHNVELDRAQTWAETAIAIQSAQLRNISLEHLTPTQLGLVRELAEEWDTMGWIYFKKVNIDQARLYIEAAWPLVPSPTVGSHLGQVYEKLNRQDDAIRTYAMTIAAADLPTRATTNPEAVAEATDRLTKLAARDVSIPDMIKKGHDDLEAMCSLSVTNLPKSSGTADFTMKVAANGSTEVRQVSGDSSFSKFTEALREVRIPMQIPGAAGIEIPRRGKLTCNAEQTECHFTLLRAEEAFDLASEEAGAVPSKLTE
jgi:TonB family protein